MDKFDIMKLNELSIEQVAGALGLSVTRHRALCPFHNDSNPSLTFNVRKNRYKCYVCDAHGGVIDLVMNYLHKDFVSACKWLADDFNIWLSDSLNSHPSTVPQPSSLNPQPSFDASRYVRFFERPFLSEDARRFLFAERKLDPRVIKWCRLTSWKDRQGTSWLQIPYYNRDGKLIGVQNRNLAYGLGSREQGLGNPSSLNSQPSSLKSPSSLNPQPRFRFPQGAICSIYNLQILNLLRPGETLFIAEGCSDAWSLMSAGYKAIAIPSATLLTRKDKELLSSLNSQPSTLNLQFHMFPDQDEPGERLFLQLREVLPSLVRHQLPAGCKDYSDYYLQSLIPGLTRNLQEMPHQVRHEDLKPTVC